MVASLLAASTVSALAGPKPSVATEIANFEREKEAAMRPIVAKYQQHVGQMLADFVRAGRLDEALAAANAMKQVTGDDAKGLSCPLADTRWSRHRPGNPVENWGVYLTKEGQAKSADGNWEERGLVTHWKYLGNRVALLTIEKGRNDQLCEIWLINPDWSSYKGFSFEGTKLEGKLVFEK